MLRALPSCTSPAPPTVGDIPHCPVRSGIKDNSKGSLKPGQQLGCGSSQSCVIAKCISKNWTCNHQDHKAPEWKAGMLPLLSVLQGAAEETPQLSQEVTEIPKTPPEIPKTPPFKGKSGMGKVYAEHCVWNIFNFLCVYIVLFMHNMLHKKLMAAQW